VQTLEEECRKISGLSEAAMRERVKSYRRQLAARGEKLNGGARKHLPEAFWSESYWEGLSREEMHSLLVLETLKGYLGKPPAEVRGSVLAPTAQPPQQEG
jgi:hypothetical protein